MKVLVIGGGITGPVLGMLLKHNGHDPIIFERHPSAVSGGITLSLTPQTMKVLRILDLDRKAMACGKPIPALIYRSEVSGKVLFENDTTPKAVQEAVGWPFMTVVDRPAYSQFLIDEAVARGIPIHYSKQLVDVKQDDVGVTAIFQDGTTESGDILVGCDGLHSAVRDTLFGKVEPEYTGIAVVAGTASIPPGVDATWGMQVFGEGAHMFILRTAEDHVCFGCTYAEPTPPSEDWRNAPKEQIDEVIKALPQSSWSGRAGETLSRVIHAVKFGMYLRPLLPVWHKGRIVLCGDAAHPTAPYLGQGANQGMEDCYHLARVLKQHAPTTTAQLDAAFTEYEQLRCPRVTKAVEQASQEGKYRVMTGRDACLQRDEMLSKGLETKSWQLIMEMTKGPYEGESEI